MGSGLTATEPARARGRRAKVSRQAIAEAVIAIGFDEASIKTVAGHLGISVPGLYHHVHGREHLLSVASQYVLDQGRLPTCEEHSWPEWLREVGNYLRAHWAERPELVIQYMSGGNVFADGVADFQTVLETLGQWGFSVVEAFSAFCAVGHLALGTAMDDIRERTILRAGHPTLAQMQAAIALDPDGLATLRQLLSKLDSRSADSLFDENLTMILRGIAADRGETWRHAQTTRGGSRVRQK
jgi:AcrR family transcriptional regulator